jgi:N6-adenosine-specific RNA methylase IME4
MNGYRTIVADPPWDYSRDATLRFAWRRGAPSGDGKALLSYPTMTVDEIAALTPPVARDAHLYLWTTQRFLWDTPRIAAAWGFAPVKVLVWCKPPTGFALGGTFGSACEFVLFARRGSLSATAKVPRDWFEWSRRGHSVKPEAFLDLVEQVSPGPYLEMFARRQRLGWDTWGNEALEHVSLAAVRQEKP